MRKGPALGPTRHGGQDHKHSSKAMEGKAILLPTTLNLEMARRRGEQLSCEPDSRGALREGSYPASLSSIAGALGLPGAPQDCWASSRPVVPSGASPQGPGWGLP